MRHFLEILRDYHAPFTAKERIYREAMHAFQRCIDSSAMKYGIGRLPNELLLQIFSIVATDMRSTVGLSHVCQRFRSIVNGTPSFWENFWLSTGWKADQVITVAERCELHNLKAVIEGDFYFEMETTHHRLFAISAILSLSDHLVELDIRSLDAPTHVQIFRHHRNKHGSTIFPRLRSLLSKRSTNIALLFRSSEIIEMPSLQVLSVDFVPHVSQAGNLTRLAITGSTYRLSGESAAKGVSLDGCSEGFVTNRREVSTIKIGGVSQMPLGHCKP